MLTICAIIQYEKRDSEKIFQKFKVEYEETHKKTTKTEWS